MVLGAVGARCGGGVWSAGGRKSTWVGESASAVWRLHGVAAGDAGRGGGSGKCNGAAAGVLEAEACRNAGRGGAAVGPEEKRRDELCGRDGGNGVGGGIAPWAAGAGETEWSEFVHGAAGGAGSVVAADGSGGGHTHWGGGGLGE